jgi:hypothetical protein
MVLQYLSDLKDDFVQLLCYGRMNLKSDSGFWCQHSRMHAISSIRVLFASLLEQLQNLFNFHHKASNPTLCFSGLAVNDSSNVKYKDAQ